MAALAPPVSEGALDILRDEELEAVLTEVAASLCGAAATLTLHSSDGPARVIFADHDGARGAIGALIGSGMLDWRLRQADHHLWVRGDFAPFASEAIALPIHSIQGHGKLVIAVFFAALDERQKAAAEIAYRRHRSLLTGYFRLWQQERLMRRQVDASRAALDRVKVAVMLVSKSGEITFSNAAARRLLQSGKGIREQRGQLGADDRADGITLALSIAHVLDASERSDRVEVAPLFTVKRADQAPLVVTVLPVPYSVAERDETAAIVIAVDPDLGIRDYASAVCRVFGLTRVETELACELASGVALQSAAARLRIKEDTARGYLRAIFAKTGVNRQIDLVRLILVSLVRV